MEYCGRIVWSIFRVADLKLDPKCGLLVDSVISTEGCSPSMYQVKSLHVPEHRSSAREVAPNVRPS